MVIENDKGGGDISAMRGHLAIFIYKVRRKRTLVLKETPHNRKHLNKNENYNEILEMPFVFNL